MRGDSLASGTSGAAATIKQEVKGMKNTVVITNQKGGVGKSTTARALSECLQQRGFSVLLVDMDPQGNLSSAMGAAKSDRVFTSYDVIMKKCQAKDAIQHTEQGDIIPANILLAGAEQELVTAPAREQRLLRALSGVADRYDWIVIDTPPSLGLLTVNALVTADRLIVPLEADDDSLQGLQQLRGSVNMVREYFNPEIRIDGLLITKYESNVNIRKDMRGVIEVMAERIGCKVYEPISKGAMVVSARSEKVGLQAYDKKAKPAKDYERFTEAFLQEV